MVVKIKKSTKDEYNDKLVLSEMLPPEYAVVEKLYDEPLSGENVSKKDGKKFEWRLYTVAVHEYVTVDPETLEKTHEKFDEPKEVGFFKSAKTFAEPFDALPLNAKVKITQKKLEGKSIKTFSVEKIGEGDVTPTEPDKKQHNAFDKVKELKNQGVDLESVKKRIKSEFPEQTDASVEALYNAD